jgi:hypothetical protein
LTQFVVRVSFRTQGKYASTWQWPVELQLQWHTVNWNLIVGRTSEAWTHAVWN